MALLPWNWLIHHSRRTCLVLRTKFVSPYGPICHPSINNRRLIWRKDRICSRATNNALHVRSPYQVVNEVRDHATLTAGATSCPSHAKCKRWSEAKKKRHLLYDLFGSVPYFCFALFCVSFFNAPFTNSSLGELHTSKPCLVLIALSEAPYTVAMQWDKELLIFAPPRSAFCKRL